MWNQIDEKKKEKKFHFKIRWRNVFKHFRLVPYLQNISYTSNQKQSDDGNRERPKLFRETKFRPMNQHHLLSTPLSACPSINHPRWARYSAHFLVDRSGNASLSLSFSLSREREIRHACFESTGVSPSSRSLGIGARLPVATALSPFFLRGCLATTIVTIRPIMWFIPLCSR